MFKTYKGKKIPNNVPEGDDCGKVCTSLAWLECADSVCSECILLQQEPFQEWNSKGRPSDTEEEIEIAEKEEKINEIKRKMKEIKENTRKNNKKLKDLKNELEELQEEPCPGTEHKITNFEAGV